MQQGQITDLRIRVAELEHNLAAAEAGDNDRGQDVADSKARAAKN